MTPDEIFLKFSAAIDNFEPITDQPSDSDLTRLREAIAPLLLQIPYDETGGMHNLIGTVRAKPAYLKRYGEAFHEPTRVGAYDLEIYDDATAVVRAHLEAAHKARRADRATFDTGRRETTQFLLAVVADTWVQELIQRQVKIGRASCIQGRTNSVVSGSLSSWTHVSATTSITNCVVSRRAVSYVA